MVINLTSTISVKIHSHYVPVASNECFLTSLFPHILHFALASKFRSLASVFNSILAEETINY